MNSLRRWLFFRQPFGRLAGLLIIYCLNANAGNKAKENEITLKLGSGIVKAEVANSRETRERGLMQRKQLGTNSGMLFVFETPQPVCLWMKDTPLPLSAAFIDNEGHIIQTVDLEPYSEEQHCETSSIRYILEVNRNWFDQNSVKQASKVEGLPVKP